MDKHPFVSQPQTLLDVWNLYQDAVKASYPKSKAGATLSLAKTALFRYTLPGLGGERLQRERLTDWENQAALNCMSKVDLPQIAQTLQIQEQVFAQLQVPSNSQRTYRAALKKFLQWCETQAWWPGTDIPFMSSPKALKRSTSQRAANETEELLPTAVIQPRYGLGAVKGDVIPDRLQQELEAFRQFRLQEHYPFFRRVQPSTVKKDLRQILLILGWLYRVEGVPVEALSLQYLIPPIAVGVSYFFANDSPREASRSVCDLAKRYVNWLRKNSTSENPDSSHSESTHSHVEVEVLTTLLVVTQFVYYQTWHLDQETDSAPQYDELLVVRLLREELSHAQASARKQKAIKQSLNKIPDWFEFLAFVEKLRLSCEPRFVTMRLARKGDNDPDVKRDLVVIANNYQRFLLAALMAYLPPLRQQAYRNLQILDSLESLEKEDQIDHTEVSGYLYQVQWQWSIRWLKDRYKTREDYLDFTVLLPNIQYPDGRCFYQYIAEWLFEYNYQILGEGSGKIDGLRQVFEPQHNFLFTQSNGEKYHTAVNFSRLLNKPSAVIEENIFTPELVRKAFLKYALQQHPKGAELERLALQMGYSSKLLDNTYNIWTNQPSVETACEICRETIQAFLND